MKKIYISTLFFLLTVLLVSCIDFKPEPMSLDINKPDDKVDFQPLEEVCSNDKAPTQPSQKDFKEKLQDYYDRGGAKTKEVIDSLTEERLKIIWDTSKDYNLDPMLLVSILLAEGTTSFNTKASVDGGQPHPDFEQDAQRAADLIDRERDEWEKNGRPGNWLVYVNRGQGQGDVNDCYNSGYAEDGNWARNVKRIYRDDIQPKLSEGAVCNMEPFIVSLPDNTNSPNCE